MELKALDPKEDENAKKEAGALLFQAKQIALSIKDTDSYKEAAKFLLKIKEWQKWCIGYNKPFKQQIDSLKKMALDRESEMIEPSLRAEKEHIKPAMLKFEMEEEAKRKIQEERLQAEARRRQEEEQLARAAELEAQGKTQEASAVVDEPIVAPAVVVPDQNKTKGISYKTVWKFEVFDAKLVPAHFKRVDEMAIRGHVRALKERASIPGVRIYAEKEMSAGGRG